MKVFLYTEGEKLFSKSGLGKAIKHQMKALESVGIPYTTKRDEDYDIVHINFYGPNSFALAKLAKFKGKKVVYHAHSTEEDFKNGFIFCKQISPAFKKWLINCYSTGDVIITPTPYSKRLLEGYGIKKKIYAISNGIELNLFKRDEDAGAAFRRRYGYTKEDKVIIGIGLYIEKDYELFDKLYESKEDIEKKLGLKLDWERESGSTASRIKYNLKGLNYDDKSNYDKLMNKTIDIVTRMQKVFKQYL